VTEPRSEGTRRGSRGSVAKARKAASRPAADSRPAPAPDPALPPHVPPADFDYAAAFGCLAAVQAKINCYGATPELVLRRGLALMSLGNYLAAAYDAERVLQTEGSNLEAHYLHGQACLALAAVRAGVLRPGLAAAMPTAALPSRMELLDAAQQAFEVVLGRNPEDAQAQRGLAGTLRMRERLLASGIA
jgi:tetratricopeptide (TPR) repeat protein